MKNESLNGYIVTCNADIFFDKSINNLRKSNMSKEKQLLAQLRFDYTDKQLGKCKLFGPRADSQDTWIWHSRFNPYKEKKIFNIETNIDANARALSHIKANIEENRNMIISNYSSALNINTDLAKNNTENILPKGKE